MKQGFTLLELSIVLVIIGLIIGGITVGADMIRSAELSATVSEINKIKISINSYKLKYNAYPGDHKNAFAYWGADCASSAASCNGDGNGDIDNWSTEVTNIWKHLELAEIIQLEQQDHVARKISKLGGAATYYIYEDGGYPGTAGARNKNALAITESGAQSDSWREGGLNALEAHQLDTKMDDGVASTGKTTSYNGYSNALSANQSCLTSNDYDLTLTELGCWFVVWLD